MPADARLSPRAAASLAVIALALLAGCGPPPPQPSSSQDDRIAAALSGISEACGESFQQRALAGAGAAPSAAVRSEAGMRALELAHVYREVPQRIYQGETLQEVIALAAARLRECGLREAAGALARDTGKPPRSG